MYTFAGAGGATPSSGVILDGSGNLYGSTSQGGTKRYGVVYKLDSAGNETVLYNFDSNERYLEGNLALDSAGNFYGTVSGRTGVATIPTIEAWFIS